MVVVVDLDLDRVKEGLLGVSMQVDHVVLVVVGLLMRLTPGKMDLEEEDWLCSREGGRFGVIVCTGWTYNTLQIEGYSVERERSVSQSVSFSLSRFVMMMNVQTYRTLIQSLHIFRPQHSRSLAGCEIRFSVFFSSSGGGAVVLESSFAQVQHEYSTIFVL